jgi:hypothetical protein
MLTFENDFGIALDYLKAVQEVDPNATCFYLGYEAPLSEWAKDQQGVNDTVDVFDHFRRNDGKVVLKLLFRRKLIDFDDGFLDVVYDGGDS